MVRWRVDADPAVWLPVPVPVDEAEAADWADVLTDAIITDFAQEFTLAAEYREVLRHQLTILADMAAHNADRGELIAHLPGPDFYPLPVMVSFREPESESPDYLLDWAGAHSPTALEPPVIEHIVSDDLGEGVRVLRHERDDAGTVTATLAYAWRSHETDVLLFAETDDLGRLELMQGDIVGLISAVRPVADPTLG